MNIARILLGGMTSLEQRRPVHNKPYSFIYDAVFMCAESGEDGVGSFQCYVGKDKTKKQDDFYEVLVKVSTQLLMRSVHAHFIRSSDLNQVATTTATVTVTHRFIC